MSEQQTPLQRPDAEARRPDVLPTAAKVEQPTAPPTPVVTGSHIEAKVLGTSLDLETGAVHITLDLMGQDEITHALLAAIVEVAEVADVVPKQSATGLTIDVVLDESAAARKVSPMVEDARRRRLGLPSLAEEKAKADLQAQAVAAAEAEEAKAKAERAAERQKLVDDVAAEVLAKLQVPPVANQTPPAPTPRPDAPPAT